MPQSERTEIIVKLLKWFRDDVDSKGVSRAAILKKIRLEITALGSSPRTAQKYFEDIGRYGLIKNIRNTARWCITDSGKGWVDKHSL